MMRTMHEAKQPARLRWSAALPLIAGAMLAACATRTPPLYQWENYQPQVYRYFKGESKEAQVEVLERDLGKILAADGKPPPGYYAHLGMLYGSLGKDDQMVQAFEREKALFPEATAYIDFLMKSPAAKSAVTQ